MPKKPKQPRAAPRNYFSRREQRRLLILVMSIGLVVLLFNYVRKGENWGWMFGENEPVPEIAADPDYSDYDTSYQPSPESGFDAETIRIVPNDPTMVETAHYFPGVDPLLLGDVEDYTLFQPSDGKAFYHLLGILKDNRTNLLNNSSAGDVTFVQLDEQPEAYRGDLITVRGIIRRAAKLPAKPNSHGIKSYYDLVLQPTDGPLRPIALKVLNLPEGFPVEDKIREDVVVTGFFFKMLVYMGEDGNDYRMPVVLAKDISWLPSVAPQQWNPSTMVVFCIIAGMALLATLVATTVYYQSQTIRLPGKSGAGREPAPGDLAALQNAPVKTVGDQLEEMAQRE